jgi:hypothetical protein
MKWEQWNYTKTALTDAGGNFELRGLAVAPFVFSVRQNGTGSTIVCGHEMGTPGSTGKAVEIRVKRFELPKGTVVHNMFGMKLVELNDGLRTALSLYPWDQVMILDPGHASTRLSIGQLQAGDAFWMVDDTRVKDFDDFAHRLLADCEEQKQQGRSVYAVRIVYDMVRQDDEGSMTMLITLNASDLAELQKVVKR